jgi:putative transposase
MGKLCAQVAGFNLQAATRIGANDREGLARMARYLARPPIATDRLSQLDDGRLELPPHAAFARLIMARPSRLTSRGYAWVHCTFGPLLHSLGLHPKHSGPASAGRLTAIRRGPRYLLARLF